jgi:hypothetical protein
VHAEPEKTALAFELARRWPIDKESHGGIGQVLRTGEPILLEHMPDELLPRPSRGEEHLALARTLGFKSSLCLPLMARGRVLGALTLVHAESGRRFGEKDLPLVRELARRAGSPPPRRPWHTTRAWPSWCGATRPAQLCSQALERARLSAGGGAAAP